MRIKQVIKLINKSKILSKQEKRELIVKGLIETIVNAYKFIIKLPFIILGILFATIEMIFSYIVEWANLIEQVFHCIVDWLEDRLPELALTKGQARDKLMEEIKQNKFQVK